MKRRSTIAVPLFVLGVVLGIEVMARPAFADERVCASLAIDGDPEIVEAVRSSLRDRRDLDTCARATIARERGSIVVTVTLRDGRGATRQLAREEDIVPSLCALLVVPPAEPRSEAPSAVDPSMPPAPTEAVRDRVEPRAADAGSTVKVELSVLSGARIAEDRASIGIGALSFVDVSGWLVGFSGRADRFEAMTGGQNSVALSLAVLGGRRFRFRSTSLDLYAGPEVALQGDVSRDIALVPGRGPAIHESTSGGVPRALVGARLSFRPRSVFRTFVAIDGDFGETGEALGPGYDFEPLPAWSLGLALGMTVGTL